MTFYGAKLTKVYDLYRNAPVGVAMFDTIHDLVERKILKPRQALIVVTQFDLSIRKIMDKRQKEENSLFSFEAEKIWYQLRPDGWYVLILEDVSFYQHIPTEEIQMYKRRKYLDQQVRWKAGKGKKPTCYSRGTHLVYREQQQQFLKL